MQYIFLSHAVLAYTCLSFQPVCFYFPFHYLCLQIHCRILRKPIRFYTQFGISTSSLREQEQVNSTERCKRWLQVRTHHNVQIFINLHYSYLRRSRFSVAQSFDGLGKRGELQRKKSTLEIKLIQLCPLVAEAIKKVVENGLAQVFKYQFKQKPKQFNYFR